MSIYNTFPMSINLLPIFFLSEVRFAINKNVFVDKPGNTVLRALIKPRSRSVIMTFESGMFSIRSNSWRQYSTMTIHNLRAVARQNNPVSSLEFQSRRLDEEKMGDLLISVLFVIDVTVACLF